jgi:hypothetical protein
MLICGFYNQNAVLILQVMIFRILEYMPQENVICLESIAFEKLVDRLVGYIKEKHLITHDIWVTGDEAMKLLNITSKTTLQTLRDTGKIRFTHPMHKVLLYDRQSILDYLETHARNTF